MTILLMKYCPITFVLKVSIHWCSSDRKKCFEMASAELVSGVPFTATAS